MKELFGVWSPGVFQGAVALFEDALGASVVDGDRLRDRNRDPSRSGLCCVEWRYVLCRDCPGHPRRRRYGMGQAMLLCSTPQAAERLGLSPHTLEGYRITGEGPVYYRFGSVVRNLSADVEAWAAARRRDAASDKGEAVEAGARWCRRKPAQRVTGERDEYRKALRAISQIRGEPDSLKGRLRNR